MLKLDLQIEKETATLRGRVEEKLRYAIVSGHFAPGQRLVERELCELLGVGRTSVREAMRQLEAEGLIASIPHRGPVVQGMTLDEARQLYEFRILLESYAARCCAERADDDQKLALEAAYKAFVTAAAGESHDDAMRAKDRLYEVLLTGARNPFVKQTLTATHNRITMLRFASIAHPGRLQESALEIREIVAAVLINDGAAAEFACRRHVQRAAEVAIASMIESERTK